MKLIYILSQSHSGSTLTDCVLGTHPDVFSSGELRYLNWQIARTMSKPASVEAENICTCGQDWRECEFWSNVFREIKQETGSDIISDPESFDLRYFGAFSHQDRGGYPRSILDHGLGFMSRLWLERGLPLEMIIRIKPRVLRKIQNNWLLYEIMARVGEKPIIVDSSKHLLIALLLQSYRPDDVCFLFLHRDPRGLVASYKKLSKHVKTPFSISDSLRRNEIFKERVSKYKRQIPYLNWLEYNYEDVASAPADFLDDVVKTIGLSRSYATQPNEDFWIDPRKHHMVAGNPMRYRGRQLVRYDERWPQVLDQEDLAAISRSR